jgi:50S ribosomal protein L16 3-hydroxylase
MSKTPLGGRTVAEFLRRHWQKRPLLARNALPEFARAVRRETLFALAARDDLESRLVERRGRRWRVRHGPFDPRELERLPRSGWTLLVQGVENALPAARALLDRFAFIPYARLDDVMVSYAPAGGGVGPHFDDYDVFLLQGEGRRRWRVSRQRDLELVEGAPLKLLRRFRPRREWDLGPGDLLYLPPRHAHDGVALGGDCITYSIGFRAPAAQELAAHFLEYLQDQLQLSGIYRDPGLKPQHRPGRIGDDFVRKAAGFLRAIRWSKRDVARFLGCHLTEPKAQVLFRRPRQPLSRAAFAAGIGRRGARLAAQTRMLYRGTTVFINGEAVASGTAMPLLAALADRRSLPPRPRMGRATGDLLYRWYRAGYILLNGER